MRILRIKFFTPGYELIQKTAILPEETEGCQFICHELIPYCGSRQGEEHERDYFGWKSFSKAD